MEIMEISKEKIEIIKEYIGPFSVDFKRQEKVYEEIRESAEGDFDFYVLLISAAIIITLGLIINSSSVVIGGMLLAPLVWPILALSLGIIKGRSKLLQESSYTLLKSTILIFVIAVFLGLIAPDYALKGSEFLSRTTPTIFELFIALAAGFVGAFAITYPKIGSALAGVAMAAALVPPVAVMGVSISHGNLGMAGGAFLLYMSNLIAIIFSSSALFALSRFKGPSTELGQEKRKSGIRWATIFLFVLTIPLLLITSRAIIEKKQQTIVSKIVSAQLSEAVVDNLSIDDKKEIIVVNITIQYSGDLENKEVAELKNMLSQAMKKTVVLRITVVPIIKLWEENGE